ncbi:ABC transporter permease [Spelaeicoccus albus]|uniref:NitT/TauT family transport system permease protein n=2 Tax=Spelaeicoccus albus TaxID=1280376 RepID=A0A7Z0D1G0_9MICO|nr:NitT/TauT family transport system permease protein [Spelaeicoccus albus]
MAIVETDRAKSVTASNNAAAARGTSRRVRMISAQIAIGILLVGAWEFLVKIGLLDPFFFSDPWSVGKKIWEWFATGSIFPHLEATALASLLAFVIGVIVGLVFGVLLGRVRILAELADPYIKMLNALPRLVLAPIFLLWFGIGIWSKVALGVTLVGFIVFFNTFEGVRSVSKVHVRNSRMLGASETQLLRSVYIPSAFGSIFSSLHTSVGFAIIGAVVGEYLGAVRGMGYLIAQAQGTFQTDTVMAGLIVLMVFVLVIEFFVTIAEKRLLAYRQAEKD